MTKQTVLIILGTERNRSSKGKYNKGLFEIMVKKLNSKYNVLTSIIQKGYKIQDEIEKFKKADIIIYQYPVFWFMMPHSLKKYIDDVFKFGEFFAFTGKPYGEDGLFKDKKFMLSTTWNTPRSVFNKKNGFFKDISVDDVTLPMRKSNTYCGLKELKHFSCHDVVMYPHFDKDAKRLEKHLEDVFGV